MIKVKQFSSMEYSNYGTPVLDDKINNWIDSNKHIEVIDIKFQSSMDNVNNQIYNVFIVALVIYKEEI